MYEVKVDDVSVHTISNSNTQAWENVKIVMGNTNGWYISAIGEYRNFEFRSCLQIQYPENNKNMHAQTFKTRNALCVLIYFRYSDNGKLSEACQQFVAAKHKQAQLAKCDEQKSENGLK